MSLEFCSSLACPTIQLPPASVSSETCLYHKWLRQVTPVTCSQNTSWRRDYSFFFCAWLDRALHLARKAYFELDDGSERNHKVLWVPVSTVIFWPGCIAPSKACSSPAGQQDVFSPALPEQVPPLCKREKCWVAQVRSGWTWLLSVLLICVILEKCKKSFL